MLIIDNESEWENDSPNQPRGTRFVSDQKVETNLNSERNSDDNKEEEKENKCIEENQEAMHISQFNTNNMNSSATNKNIHSTINPQ